MKTDIEITKEFALKPIEEIAKKVGIEKDELVLYGNVKAKVDVKKQRHEKGKLILVTAISPTKAGEGKSTTTIGLGDGLNYIGKQASIALREPSLGPVFGLKGGACGGGYAQVVPMEDINLHFTGDMHAITSANNLISACLDNHIYQGNELQFDLENISWKRCMDMNDRTLRNVEIGRGKKVDGVEREDHFQISVASEIMAILCLATSFKDLKNRIAKIHLGYSTNNTSIHVKDLGIVDAVCTLLKDAILPNLVQTLYETPAFIHGGPFANIAHGCNSILATKLALSCSDYVVTEAGFGADLGAEKFMDIVCPIANAKPSAVVLVATIRALKLHGGVAYENLNEANVEAVKLGCENLGKHMDTLNHFGAPYVVVLNEFYSDTKEEVDVVREFVESQNQTFTISTSFKDGAKGGSDMAQAVVAACEKENSYAPLYTNETSIKENILRIAKTCYGAKDVQYSEDAKRELQKIKDNGWESLRICMAKTPNSLSDDAKVLGAPKDFTLHIRNVSVSLGAGFVVVYTGNIMTMPGLPKVPAANKITISDDKEIDGLF